MIRASSTVIGGPFGEEDESEAVEEVRDEDADELGGDGEAGCSGTDWPAKGLVGRC